MSPQIQIPVKPFAAFIDAAFAWLSKTSEMKTGLELRLFKEGQDLHVSVGADSNSIEAVLEADVSALTAPIFLDMSYLANYTFDIDSLALVIPQPGGDDKSKIERRAQFKAPGQNFRIPIRAGVYWERNEQDLNQFADTPGFSMTRDLVQEIYPYLELPDSFDARKKALPQLAFEQVGDFLQCYTWDGFGAFWHSFKFEGFQPLSGFKKILIPYEFLIPYKKIKEFSHLTLKQSSKLSLFELSGMPGFKRFRWLQPRYVKGMEDIPTALQRIRAKADTCLTFDTQEFLRNTEKATVFLRGARDMQGVSLSFSIIQDSYALSTNTPDSEMIIEGKAKSSVPTHKHVSFQPACLMDYLKCLERGQDFNMELFNETLTLFQDVKTEKGEKKILYWMPVYLR